MFKKLLSLCSAVLGLGLLVGSMTSGQADSISGSTLSGPLANSISGGSGVNVNLYTIITAYKAPNGAVSGYAYFGTVDGGWMWADMTQVHVVDAHNAEAVAFGYFEDAMPAIAYWSMKNNQISVRIVDFYSGQVYEDTAPGAVSFGGVALAP